MEDVAGIAISTILIVGIGAQWLAWRLKFPSILLLLMAGLVVGPGLLFLQPDQVFNREVVLQITSFSVAIILFEGGLSLKFKDVKKVGGSVLSLVTVGALVTWGVASVAAKYILNFDWSLSLLIGGIVIVTGPTVIGPILRQLRPKKQVAALLKWEGIVIDPIGALVAVLVFETAFISHGNIANEVTNALLITTGVGFGLGLVLAGLVIILLHRFWIPEYLHSPFMLATVIGAFALSNSIQHESGLLTVTVLGVALANQKFVHVDHILEFKENLQVLLISSLFVMLAARIDRSTLLQIGSQSVFFLLVLVVIARPLSIFVSTLFSKIDWKEKALLAFMAPRGIVAAAIASVFALRLEEANVENADLLVPNVFLVIVGTVLIYGLGAGYVSRILGLSNANPQGALIIGSSRFTVSFAQVLKDKGVRTLLVDTNWGHVLQARMRGLEAIQGNALTEKFADDLDLAGIGKVFAMTPNNEVNSLALIQLSPIFTNERCYQLMNGSNDDDNTAGEVSSRLKKRVLFSKESTYGRLDDLIEHESVIKATKLSPEYEFTKFNEDNPPERTILLATISESGNFEPYTVDYKPKPKSGTTLIYVHIPQEGSGINLANP